MVGIHCSTRESQQKLTQWHKWEDSTCKEGSMRNDGILR
jgi:hypothetical protein